MIASTISLDISATGADLNITVRSDDCVVYHGEPRGTVSFQVIEPGPHALEIELSGKLPEHTKVDADGNIVEDRLVSISNLKFDDIELGQVFYSLATYCHDVNGTAEPREDKFYGTMGCNGIIRLEFSSPVYIWLLENM